LAQLIIPSLFLSCSAADVATFSISSPPATAILEYHDQN
jgi:hypothetical protein